MCVVAVIIVIATAPKIAETMHILAICSSAHSVVQNHKQILNILLEYDKWHQMLRFIQREGLLIGNL